MNHLQKEGFSLETCKEKQHRVEYVCILMKHWLSKSDRINA